MRKVIPRHSQTPASPPPILERVKSAWEKVAVVSALAYALGYVARAIHAWDYNFGALPGARFDYLMAGLFLSIPVAVLAAAVLGGRKALLGLNAWAQANPGSAGVWQRRLLFPVLLASLALLLASDKLTFLAPALREALVPASATAFVLTAVLTGVLAPETPARSSAFRPSTAGTISRWLGTAFSYVVTGYFGVLFLLLFAVAALLGAELLTRWPQELGGVKPKCAVLDIAVNQLSPEMLSLLVPAQGNPAPGQEIARSHQLEVFSTSGPWLIRTPEPGASAPLRRSIRLAEQAVRSVEWVARATPLPQGNRACPTS
jgi:hypothetical protein